MSAGWLARLNHEQRTAVACTDAPLLIVAGPGTGKTRTLTVRIAYLIHELGVEPENCAGDHLHQQGRRRTGRAPNRFGSAQRSPAA